MANKLGDVYTTSSAHNLYTLKRCKSLLFHIPRILETDITQYRPGLRDTVLFQTRGGSVNS